MQLNSNYNPDVLTCLANLSNDEVFTPPAVVNQMLDMLPAELFRSPKTTFLDPVSKSGVFLREIAKRLMLGLEQEFPDVQERANHIFTRQLYGLSITELTSLISRRSVYCSKKANGRYSLCTAFADEQGNIRYRSMEHTFVGGKCKYCGAAENVFGKRVRGNLESHAYEFIHNLKNYKDMKFDVIIGNPPYQLNDGGGAGTSAVPIYQKFVEQAKKLNPRFLSMIIPARWYSGGKGLDEFRMTMLNDKHIRHLVDYMDSNDCFAGVDIAGGVCYFLWDRDNEGTCRITGISKFGSEVTQRYLGEYSTFIRQAKAVNIVYKVMSTKCKMMDEVVFSRKPFGLGNTYIGKNSYFDGCATLYGSQGLSYIYEDEIQQNKELLNRWKVIASKASAQGGRADSEGKRKVIPKVEVLPPGTICTESYLLIAHFDNETEATNAASYVKTMFFRFLLSLKVITQNISKDSFGFVPLQDFSHPWTDEMLYEKYKLSPDEIAFIESMIRPME